MNLLPLEEVFGWFVQLNQVKYYNPQLKMESDKCWFKNDHQEICYYGNNKFTIVAVDKFEFSFFANARSEIIGLFKSLEIILASDRYYSKEQKKGDLLY